MVLQLRTSLYRPDLHLLRKKPTQFIIDSQTLLPMRVWTENVLATPSHGQVDLLACERVMRDDKRDRKETYQAAVLCDILRFSPPSRFVNYYQQAREDRVITPETVPPLYHRMSDLLFLHSINNIKDPFTKLLNKGLNQRCMSRKFGDVAIETYQQSSEAMVIIRQILLLSLLGNYEHARPSSRPSRRGRLWLYRHFEGYVEDSWATSFHLRLYKICPYVILFAMREYLVYCMEDDPSFQEFYESFADFARFKQAVIACMDDIRAWFSMNLDNERSSLYQADWHPNRRMEDDFIHQLPTREESYFFDVLNHQIIPRHRLAILRCCYKRPNSTILTVLNSLRAKIPLVLRPGFENTVIEKQTKKQQEEEDSVTATDMTPYLPQHQINALRKVVERALQGSNSPPAALMKSLHILECFGVQQTTAETVRQTLQQMQAGLLEPRLCIKKLKSISQTEPHAYNVLQGIVELLREMQRIRELCILPLHYIRNQLAAIKARFGIHAKDPRILTETLNFISCPVCDSVYSLLREFQSAHVNSYGYGLRDALVSYTTHRLYCLRSKVNHRGRCDQQELVSYPLLGRMILFQGKRILLCPQPMCGMPMVLDTRQCLWTSHGPACYDCTYRIKQMRLKYNIAFMTRCALCNIELRHKEAIFLYPHQVALCQKHHKRYPQLQVELETPEALSLCVDKQSTIQFMVQYHRRRKLEHIETQKPFMKFALQQSRNRSRNRACNKS